jgi:hypothetical protein
MERAVLDRLEGQVSEQVRARFPGNAVRQAVVLQYGDDPVIEPGELMVRVVIEAADGPGDEEPGAVEQSLEAFADAHKAAMREFRQQLEKQIPEVRRVEFVTKLAGEQAKQARMIMRIGPPANRDRAAGELTPVMARLAPVDLETLDALIAAGIAANRADAVRWALARIRERPAFAQLQERVREIEELKAQF